jgi:biotin carboxyl carrier protein
MRDGEVRTDTIAALDLPSPPPIRAPHWQVAASLLTPPSSDPWAGGWRLAASPRVRVRQGDEERAVAVEATADLPDAVRDGRAVHVDVDGQSLSFELAPAPTVEDAVRHAAAGAEGASVLTAPMPGRVIALRAAEGAAVEAHQVVVIIEAMKMEHAVVAPLGGVLVQVHVAEGQQVQRGDLLAEVAAYHGADG